MRRRLSPKAALLVAAALLASGAVSQEMEGITVVAKQVEKTAVRTEGIVQQFELSSSYRVTYGDVDVSTQAGREEVKRRIDKAADLACRDIARAYPLSEPSHQACANRAAKDAMAEFHKRVDAK